MLTLLAQTIPGYQTDDPSTGKTLFGNFFSLFSPHDPFRSTGLLISRLVLFAIVSAGLFFFVKLILAGYAYLTSLGEPAKLQSASKDLTNAAIGLIIIVSSFFLIQIIQVVFGIQIV